MPRVNAETMCDGCECRFDVASERLAVTLALGEAVLCGRCR